MVFWRAEDYESDRLQVLAYESNRFARMKSGIPYESDRHYETDRLVTTFMIHTSSVYESYLTYMEC